MANLQAGHTRWYDIKAQDAGPHQVSIYDEIGFWGVTAQQFVNDIKGVSGDLDVHINSPGGNIFDGLAIYNTLRQRPGRVHVVVDGLAASAASFIAQAASPGELEVAQTSTMMIHDGYGIAEGNAEDARQLAALLDKQSDVIASIYAERTGRPASQWRDLMKAETWYSAGEAVSSGLADRILTATQNTALSASSVDESAWDAARAWTAGAASDNPEAFYRGICAGEKTVGDPGTQAHWALPYKYSPSSPPNRHGVSAALGRLGSTDDLKDPAAVRARLESAQKAMGSGSGASDHADTDIGLEYDPDLFIGLLKGAVK
jgi:ATP-dependent Clp endopeptidase proteolytic subunit ClpP